MSFKEIDITSLPLNPFKEIGKNWALITAGGMEDYNTMTISWGGMGVIWGKNVFTAVVRPERHTFGYVERNDLFTISFFGGECREALAFCGSHSGRDCDKAEAAGLSAEALDGAVTFSQAKLVLVCKKLYRHQLEAKDFLDGSLTGAWYNGDGFHHAYVGEILKAYVSE